MGEKFELSYLDLCRLSQAFNRDANLAEPGDYRINEWLKQEIACRTIKVERAIGFVRVFRCLCLWREIPFPGKRIRHSPLLQVHTDVGPQND